MSQSAQACRIERCHSERSHRGLAARRSEESLFDRGCRRGRNHREILRAKTALRMTARILQRGHGELRRCRRGWRRWRRILSMGARRSSFGASIRSFARRLLLRRRRARSRNLLPGGVRDVLTLREATQSVDRIDAAIFSGDARAQSEVVAELARANPAAFRSMFAEAARVLAGMGQGLGGRRPEAWRPGSFARTAKNGHPTVKLTNRI